MLEDSDKDAKKDVLVHFYHFLSGKDKHFIRQVSAHEGQREKDVKKLLEPERTQLYLQYGVSIQGIRQLLFTAAPQQVGLLGAGPSSIDAEQPSAKALSHTWSGNKVVPLSPDGTSPLDDDEEAEAAREAELKEEALREELVKTQVMERLGPIFGDVDKRTIWTSTFFLAAVYNKVVSGILTGIQQGADVSTGSSSAIALNIGLLLSQGLFSIWMVMVRPQRAFTAVLLACISEWLQTGTCFCIVILQFCTTEDCNANTQKASLYFQIGIVVMQLLSALFMILAMITMTRKEVKAEAMRQEVIKKVKEERLAAKKAGGKREIKPHLAASLKLAINKSKSKRVPPTPAAPPQTLVIGPEPSRQYMPSLPVTASLDEPKPPPKPVYRAPLPKQKMIEEEEDEVVPIKPWAPPPLLREEKPEFDPDIPPDQWRPENSTFVLRSKENDSRELIETEDSRQDQFELEWQRLVLRDRFKTALMSREKQISAKNKTPLRQIEDVLAEVKMVASSHKEIIRNLFSYSCVTMAQAPGSDGAFKLREKGWMGLFDEMAEPSRTSLTGGERVSNIRVRVSNQGAGSKKFALSQDILRNIFLATNARKKIPGHADSIGSALVRFEFYEALIRASLHWSEHGHGSSLMTAAVALDSFVRQALLSHVAPVVLEDTNFFRVNRMYTQAVEASIQVHSDLIEAMFNLYRDKYLHFLFGAALFPIEAWDDFLEGTKLLEYSGLDKRQAMVIFVRSQMIVIDELKLPIRSKSLTYYDFIEALLRLAEASLALYPHVAKPQRQTPVRLDRNAPPSRGGLALAGAPAAAARLEVRFEGLVDYLIKELEAQHAS